MMVSRYVDHAYIISAREIIAGEELLMEVPPDWEESFGMMRYLHARAQGDEPSIVFEEEEANVGGVDDLSL